MPVCSELRGYEVVGEASNGLEAIKRARDLRPDLVLMDVRMPEMGGLEARRIIKTELPDTNVVILTVFDDEEDLFEAIKSGAKGYLLKKLKSDVFFELISGVANWGRMAIVDTKPFKLRVILHRIFVERPQVTGIPAWPGGAACYRRSRCIL